MKYLFILLAPTLFIFNTVSGQQPETPSIKMLKKLRIEQDGRQNLVVISAQSDREAPSSRIEMIDSSGNQVSLITPLDSLLTSGKNAHIIKQSGMRNAAIIKQTGKDSKVYIKQSPEKE